MLPLFQNSFLYSKNPSFLSRISTNNIFRLKLPKKQIKKQFQICDQTHKLTPMKRNKVCKYILKNQSHCVESLPFYLKYQKTIYKSLFCKKRRMEKIKLNLL